MSYLLDKIQNITLSGVLGKIFFLLILTNLVIGTDIVLTGVGIGTTPVQNLVPDADWGLGNNNDIEFDIIITIPNEGFIPKSAKLDIEISLSHDQTTRDPDSERLSTTLILGERLDLSLNIAMSSTLSRIFDETGYVFYEVFIQITPEYLGMSLESALRQVVIEGTIG